MTILTDSSIIKTFSDCEISRDSSFHPILIKNKCKLLHLIDRRADQVIVIVWIISVTVSALTVHSVDEENQLMLRSRLFNQSDSMRWECVASFSPFYAIWLVFLDSNGFHYLLSSATVSFIIPGIIIVVSNIGIITVSAKLNERNRKRMLSSPAGMLKRKNPRFDLTIQSPF